MRHAIGGLPRKANPAAGHGADVDCDTSELVLDALITTIACVFVIVSDRCGKTLD